MFSVTGGMDGYYIVDNWSLNDVLTSSTSNIQAINPDEINWAKSHFSLMQLDENWSNMKYPQRLIVRVLNVSKVSNID